MILLLGLDTEVFITPLPDGPQRKNEVSLVEAKVLGVVKPVCKAECTVQHTLFHKVMTMCVHTLSSETAALFTRSIRAKKQSEYFQFTS